MTVTLQEFVRSLSDTGLVTSDEAQDILADFQADEESADVAEFARELVSRKKLTGFQAKAIYQGKGRGLVLGDYLILDKLGQGGMGYVYKAKHTQSDRIVALKVLPSRFTRPQFRRFRREAETAVKLNHPNIVAAYDADQAGTVPYLVMECVDGPDLAALVSKCGPLPIAQAVSYICQAAKALQYAHSQKIIHRDIKPQNLLLDRKGVVKVLDMGLARAERTAGLDGSTCATSLTQEGTILGTIDYMPPEQVTNPKSVDYRADIYSLGCTLFYVLTGRPVYSGDELIQKIMAHREQPIPSLCSLRKDTPKVLDAIFQRMVAKTVEDRYQSMTEVTADLQACVAMGHMDLDQAASFHGDSPTPAEALLQTEIQPLETLTDQWLRAEMSEPGDLAFQVARRRRTRRIRLLLIAAATAVTVGAAILLFYSAL